MHAGEEGRLAWEDTNQWSLNRLGASQIVLSNHQTTFQLAREICRYVTRALVHRQELITSGIQM